MESIVIEGLRITKKNEEKSIVCFLIEQIRKVSVGRRLVIVYLFETLELIRRVALVFFLLFPTFRKFYYMAAEGTVVFRKDELYDNFHADTDG